MQESLDYATSWQVQEKDQIIQLSDSKSEMPLKTGCMGNVMILLGLRQELK